MQLKHTISLQFFFKLAGHQDDFTALKLLVTRLVENDCLAKGACVMNVVGLVHGKEGFRPSTLLGIFCFPNKGFQALHQLLLWEAVHEKLTRGDKGEWRNDAIACIGAATDSAGFQLAAAITNMSPSPYQISKGVVYLSLGVPGERFVAPFRGKFPFISYLDYPHNRRLFLKCMKYETLQMTMYSEGRQCYWITVNHLKELRERCKDEGVELSITATDLLLIRFMDQNIDACDKVFTTEVADLLTKYVPNANATSLYIKAVYLLTEPFKDLNYGGRCPQQIQKSISAGIMILRLWKKFLELKKVRLHAAPGAKSDQKRAGSFITYGCFMTAEIHFAAATLHMLAMCACFPHLGVGWCSPHYANTLPTEHSIGEMQGKTNQFQSVNQQPTFGDMLHKARFVEFNQEALQRLASSGVQIPASSSHKRKQRRHQQMVSTNVQNYPPYNTFKQMQQKAHQEGIQYAQSLIEEYLPCEFKKTLQKAGAWNCPYYFDLPENISLYNGSLPVGYEEMNISVRDDPYINLKHADAVAQAIKSMEPDTEDEDEKFKEEETTIEDNEADNDYNNYNEDDDDDEKTEEKTSQRLDKWYISRMVNGHKTRVHVRQALKLILPREYVSRERAKRHMASKYLKGFAPIQKDHDILQFHFVAVKNSQKHKDYEVMKIQAIRKTVDGKSTDVVSASSKDKGVELRGIPYYFRETGNLSTSDSVELTRWIKGNSVLTEVHLEEIARNTFALTEESRRRLDLIKDDYDCSNIETENNPLHVEDPYYQVEDIVDVKHDMKTGATMYLARFKGYGPDDDQWLFASAFREAFEFTNTSSSGRKIKRRIRDDEISEEPVPCKKVKQNSKKGTTKLKKKKPQQGKKKQKGKETRIPEKMETSSRNAPIELSSGDEADVK